MSEHETTETTAPIEKDSPGGRHPVSVGHLVMGVAFAGLVVVWALIAGDVVDGADIRWLLPAPWVLAGVAGLLALITSDRRRAARQRGLGGGTTDRS